MKTIEYQGITYQCPFSEHFRRHTKEERLTLAASIQANGIKQPVLVYEDEQYGENCILDGEGRLTAANGMHGVKVPFKLVGKMTTDEAFAQAKIYNDHRRQDDPESIAKRKAERIERVAEARAEGKSLREIAEDEGVSKSQIEKDVNQLSTGGQLKEPTQVKGKDGKTRTAKPKKAKKTPEPTPTPEPVKQSDDEPGGKLTDEQSPGAPETVNPVAVIESVCRQIDQLNKQLDGIKKEPLAYPVHFHSVQSALKNAREILWASRAVHTDPYCKGTGTKNGSTCNACKGTGKVIKSVNTQAVRAVGAVEDAA